MAFRPSAMGPKTPRGGDLGPYRDGRLSAKLSATTESKGVQMDSPTSYFHWGFILISLPNLLVIAGMIVLFAIALVAPFPHEGEQNDGRR